MHPLGFCLAYVTPASVVAGLWLGGSGTFLTPVIAFIIIPLLDLIIGTEQQNPTEEENKKLEEHLLFRWVLYLAVPMQVGIVVWGAYVVAQVPLSMLELVGFVFSIGIMGAAIAINVGHELCHRSLWYEKNMAKLMLLTVSYMHFYIEHRKGHHARVATWDDPASGRLGESVYAFWLRSVIYSFRSAWEIETLRLKQKNLPFWSHYNQMLWFMILPILFASGLALAFGWQALPYFMVQSILGFSFLEVINYIEHYGLERKEVTPGHYEGSEPLRHK